MQSRKKICWIETDCIVLYMVQYFISTSILQLVNSFLLGWERGCDVDHNSLRSMLDIFDDDNNNLWCLLDIFDVDNNNLWCLWDIFDVDHYSLWCLWDIFAPVKRMATRPAASSWIWLPLTDMFLCEINLLNTDNELILQIFIFLHYLISTSKLGHFVIQRQGIFIQFSIFR
jgi:hypothetical protein